MKRLLIMSLLLLFAVLFAIDRKYEIAMTFLAGFWVVTAMPQSE